MLPAWLQIGATYLLGMGLVGAVFRLPGFALPPSRTARLARWAWRRLRPAPAVAEHPRRRPLEVIARDVRRHGRRLQGLPHGASYVKVLAVLHAYDRALAEACAALEVDHLLGVLGPGPERDAERARVESRLWLAGLRVDVPG